MMPRIWADVLGTMVYEGNVRGQVVSCFVQTLVKCTRIVEKVSCGRHALFY
jgi:hypothetical protein